MIKKIFFLLLLTSIVFASKNKEEFPDQINFKVAGLFIGGQNSDLKVVKDGIGGVLNLQDLFNLDTNQFSFRLDSSYRFNDNHAVELSFYRIINNGYTDKGVHFTWGDKEIIASGELSSHFNTDIYKVNYLYSFYHSNKVEMKLTAGIHITTIDLGFEGKFTDKENPDDTKESSKEISTLAPLPVVGYRMQYAITPAWVVNFGIDYFYLSFSGFSGGMSDLLLGIDYHIFKNFGIGVSVNSTKLHFKMIDDDMTYNLVHSTVGALFYLNVNF